MVDEKKPAKAESKADKDGCFKVKNLTNRTLNLAKGQIESGETGKATAAECSNLSKFIEKV